MKTYQLSAEEVVQAQHSRLSGLTANEADQRLK